jgi:chromosome segregation ATPase
LTATEAQIDSMRVKKNESDKERVYLCAERDDAKARLAELNRLINQVESQILALERNIKHVRNYNNKYDSELDEENRNYHEEAERNGDLDAEVNRLEQIFQESQSQFEDLKNELRKNQNMYLSVDEDNKLLEIDIEKYKEAIRSLSVQNDELLYELEKITEQDESVRYILNRKSRIETLIEKAEEQVERNQIKEDVVRVTHTHSHYSERREG